jgi:hypothetical protein
VSGDLLGVAGPAPDEAGVRRLRMAGTILAHAEERVQRVRPGADGYRIEPLGEEA